MALTTVERVILGTLETTTGLPKELRQIVYSYCNCEGETVYSYSGGCEVDEAQVQTLVKGQGLSDSNKQNYYRVERNNGILDCTGFVTVRSNRYLLVFPNGVSDGERVVIRYLTKLPDISIRVCNTWIVKNHLVVVGLKRWGYCSFSISLQDAWDLKPWKRLLRFDDNPQCFIYSGVVVGESVYLLREDNKFLVWQPLTLASSFGATFATTLDYPPWDIVWGSVHCASIGHKAHWYFAHESGTTAIVYNTITKSWESVTCPPFSISNTFYTSYREGFLSWNKNNGRSRYWDPKEGNDWQNLTLTMDCISSAIVV